MYIFLLIRLILFLINKKINLIYLIKKDITYFISIIALVKNNELNEVFLNNLNNNIIFYIIILFYIYSFFLFCAAVSLIGTPNKVNNFPVIGFNFKNAESMNLPNC